MNIAHLDALPGLRTDIDAELGDDEKVVFTARFSCFGTETDQFLGGRSSRLYLTNRRIIADNTVGLWSVDLVEDVGLRNRRTRHSLPQIHRGPCMP